MTDLMNTNLELLVTTNIVTYDPAKAKKLVQRQITRSNSFMYGHLKYQQEAGLVDALPVGSHRKFKWLRHLNTKALAIMQPFNAKEIRQANSIYYGMNKLSNNLILFDRIRSLINPSGFILGCPGAGKSFTAKREMLEVFLRYKNADIMIIDPEREYPAVVEMFGGTSVKISLGSRHHINPFEVSVELIKAAKEDPEINIKADKAILITSFISCMDIKNPINAQEKSFIDRCVRLTYEQTGYLETHNPKDAPTLKTFYEIMSNETENVDTKIKTKLLQIIEAYVKGSYSYYNNQTNVDVDNRVISFDIKDLPGALKTQSMLLVLDYIWNRLSSNQNRGVSTWIYMDEAHLLFADEYCLDFLRALYKRARKYGGVVTGITQNIEDLLRNESCRTMLSNSEFLILLKQAPADIIKLKDTLQFNDGEIHFVQNTKPGEGLLRFGSSGKDIIPFYDQFPTDTDLYKRMSTSFSEKIAEKQKQKQTFEQKKQA